MTKTTFTATDAAGTVHKRKTERTYTHTVVAQCSKQWDIESAHAMVKQDIKNGRYMLEQVAIGGNSVYTAERYIEMLGGAKTAEAYADARLAERLAQIEANDYARWINQGWCGRPDLARNLQANCMKGGRYLNATILPAVAL